MKAGTWHGKGDIHKGGTISVPGVYAGQTHTQRYLIHRAGLEAAPNATRRSGTGRTAASRPSRNPVCEQDRKFPTYI